MEFGHAQRIAGTESKAQSFFLTNSFDGVSVWPRMEPVKEKVSNPRLKAFRVPYSYAVDQMVGYQGKAASFKIYRAAKDTFPEGAVVQSVKDDPAHQGFYIVIAHPSFPEYELGSGKAVPEIKFMVEEIEVNQKDQRYEFVVENSPSIAQQRLLAIKNLLANKTVELSLNVIGDLLQKIVHLTEIDMDYGKFPDVTKP